MNDYARASDFFRANREPPKIPVPPLKFMSHSDIQLKFDPLPDSYHL